MPSLKKNTLAFTFKYDCDRYLRYSLASIDERKQLRIQPGKSTRPGIDLIIFAGTNYELEKFKDLVSLVGAEEVANNYSKEKDKFLPLLNIFDLLSQETPPTCLIEAQFPVPLSAFPRLTEAYRDYKLEPIEVRPDILWVKPYSPDTPLIRKITNPPKYEIHVIDVKLAAEPSLRHFAEVTYYAIALQAALEKAGLSDRYGVSAEGLVWPGSYDTNAFRNVYRTHISHGVSNPLEKSFNETLIPVPYEIYQTHVKQFFEDRLLYVLSQDPASVTWHVAPKCETCEFLKDNCLKQAADENHLSQIPWLTHGQAKILRENKINTVQDVVEAIERDSSAWMQASSNSHQLKAESPILLARAKALANNQMEMAEGRVTLAMPSWSNLNIYLTVHFDMATGITFAIGARKVFFAPEMSSGSLPETEDQTFIVSQLTNFLGIDNEKARLGEFIDCINRWLEEISTFNETTTGKKATAHIYFWDRLELTQLGRMIKRHLDDPEIREKIDLLIRFFPPDDTLPDPDYFKSQPFTIVKDVFRTLVGLPVPHNYTLIESANVFFPRIRSDGTFYKFFINYGFKADMTDQIPMERAYELWQGKVHLTHKNGIHYTQDEIYTGIKITLKERLNGLEHLIKNLQVHYGDRLLLKKSPFTIKNISVPRIPEQARQLITFSELNVITDEIKNRLDRSLPVDEREARFISIRGLELADGDNIEATIELLRKEKPRYQSRQLICMTFSQDSRDSRLREGDFLVVLSNEEPPLDLDIPWYKEVGLSFDDSQRFAVENNLQDILKPKTKISTLVRVEIAKLETTTAIPYLILSPSSERLFNAAIQLELLDFNHTMVLDPIFKDYRLKRLTKALRIIGGQPPTRKR